MSPRVLAACVALSWGAALAAQQSGAARPVAGAPAANRRVDYQRDIKPLLEKRCGECHNGTKRKGGLALETFVDILDGGKDGPIVQPGHSADSMLLERLTGAGDEEQMPKDDPPLPPAEIALIARWIDEGVRETPSGPPAPAPWVAPLTLERPTVPAAVWPDWAGAGRSPRRRLPAPPRPGTTRADRRRPVRPPRPPRSVGPAADARAVAGVPRRSEARQARPAGADAARRRRSLRRALDVVLERRAPQRGRRHLLLGGRRPPEHHAVAVPGAARQPALRPFRRGADRSGEGRRPQGLRDRCQLARRDQRRGDAVDAGGAEHVAGVPRRQPEMHLVPRQLRQQVEAEGRLRPRRLLLAGRHAADVSLRPAAGQAHRPRLHLSRLRAIAPIGLARRSARRRCRHVHRSAPGPVAADARQPHLAAAAGTRHRRHRRRDGRGAVEPGAARLARRRLRRAPVRHQAPDRDHRHVARVSDAGGTARGRGRASRLRLPRTRGPAPQRRAVRRRHRIDHRRVERGAAGWRRGRRTAPSPIRRRRRPRCRRRPASRRASGARHRRR